MTGLRILPRYASLTLGAWALGLALMVIGCSGDSDKAVVDFSQTVPVSRPGDRAVADPSPPGGGGGHDLAQRDL